ncbi:MAG: hypothetical protein IMZ69_03780 [Spirochaetes bacterium]|nr:hypothetical protein [Spirochaetota bacterium]
MIRINWREVCKFLSGAALVGAIFNFYLFAHDISLPFFRYTISPGLLGARSAVSFLAFVLFFYFGYLRRQDTRA